MKLYQDEKQERIEFFDEIEDELREIRTRIRTKFPNFNTLPEMDALMFNMIKTNYLLGQVQLWVRI
jgi:hypothetical protein|tara:strand:+ start:443 stop:640 length:198 start_codon:yes stop_codon:yes gene_type:complete